jgi:Cyclin
MTRLIACPDLCIYVVAAALECRSARRADFPHLLPITEFDAPAKPMVSVLEYVTRIAEGAQASTCVFVTALLYMQLLAEASSKFAPSAYNVHRLFITAVTLAVKWHDDIFYSNAYYAALGGIPVAELNRLELAFLAAIKYRCSTTDADLMFAEYVAISEACEACMGPAIVPELERAGVWVPSIAHVAQLYMCNNAPPCTKTLAQCITPLLCPPACPPITSTTPILANTITVRAAPVAQIIVSPCSTQPALAVSATNPAFDSFSGVFLAPCGDHNGPDTEEEPYECHAVRMLDIEYGSIVGASV